MIASAFQNISEIEASLWEAADQLRANSKLTSSEYCMPVLGVIFLRHASNRYDAALAIIRADQAAGRMPERGRITSVSTTACSKSCCAPSTPRPLRSASRDVFVQSSRCGARVV